MPCLLQHASLVTITSWLITRQHLAAKSNMKEEWSARGGGECLSVCAFLHPWVSEYLCVQLWLQSVKKGGLYQERGAGSAPQHLAQRACSYYACWWYLWEIRSGPANETHAEGLHWGKKKKEILLSRLHIFILKRLILASVSPCRIAHLQQWPSTFAWMKVKTIRRTSKSDTRLIRTDLVKYSSSAKEGTLLERGWFFVYMCVLWV